MSEIHPFYQAHRGAMEAAMRQRLDLAEAMLRERAHLADLDATKRALKSNGVDFQVTDGVLLIPPAAAHGLALEFVGQGTI